MCFTPYLVFNPETKDRIPVPCGSCPECTARRTSGWSFRLVQQEKVSSISLFVTLTYDTKYVPISCNGFMSLSKRDVQLFLKRLRKETTKRKRRNGAIKYYAAGEYGGKTKRPHYHLILFNAEHDDILSAWRDPKTKQPIGSVHFGTVSGASVGYTLKYIHKKCFRPMHRNDDREPEFGLMSKDLGLATLPPK